MACIVCSCRIKSMIALMVVTKLTALAYQDRLSALTDNASSQNTCAMVCQTAEMLAMKHSVMPPLHATPTIISSATMINAFHVIIKFSTSAGS